jgi:hypothetical protein
MIIGGLILLFPGICVLAVFGGDISLRDVVDPLGLAILGAAALGIFVIARATRRWRR